MVGRNERKWPFVGLLFVLTVVSAITVLGLVENRAKVDADGCLQETSRMSHYAVLLDSTDKITIRQASTLKVELLGLLGSAKRGSKVQVFQLTSSTANPVELIVDVCAPGEKARLLIESDRIWKERNQRFNRNIDEALQRSSNMPAQGQSPIIEAIHAIDVDSFRTTTAEKRHLLIVSDMLQYTEGIGVLNHYRKLVPVDSLLGIPQYQVRRPKLDDVEISVLYLLRQLYADKQGNKHVNWWDQLFLSSGGSLVYIDKIQGDF